MPSASPAHELAAAVDACVTLAGVRHGAPEDAVHRASVLCRRLMLALEQCAQAGWSQDDMRTAVAAARDVYASAPFARRLQMWPRGYAGDFETVEYILDHRNRAQPGTFAFGIEQVALDSAIAEQHRQKVRIQSQAILGAAIAHRGRPGGARVLVLASGGAADVRMIQDALVRLGTRVVLVDQDADALAFALERLPRLAPRVTNVCRNVIRGLVSVRAHGPFDLVVAGGLFDYLPGDLASRLLEQVRERLLTPSGQLLFTNIATGNPFRHWIECLADWRLIHRSADDVVRLCVDAGFEAEDVRVSSDPTRLALIVRCAETPRVSDFVPLSAPTAAPSAVELR